MRYLLTLALGLCTAAVFGQCDPYVALGQNASSETSTIKSSEWKEHPYVTVQGCDQDLEIKSFILVYEINDRSKAMRVLGETVDLDGNNSIEGITDDLKVTIKDIELVDPELQSLAPPTRVFTVTFEKKPTTKKLNTTVR